MAQFNWHVIQSPLLDLWKSAVRRWWGTQRGNRGNRKTAQRQDLRASARL